MKTKNITLFLALTLAGSISLAQAPAAKGKADAKAAAKKVCSKTNGTDLPFLKGHNFLVQDYNRDTATYQIISPDFPGEGSSDVTLDGLAISSSKIKKDLDTLRKHPEDIIDQTYMAEEDLPTLFDEERDARKGCPN